MKDKRSKRMNRERKNINRLIRYQNNAKSTYRKMVVLGSTNSGKTTLINQFLAHNAPSFSNNKIEINPAPERSCSSPQIHRDYLFKGHNLKLDIVDVPDKMTSSINSNIETADVILLCYQYNNLESVEKALKLYVTIREIRADKMPLVLVATKSDLKENTFHYKDAHQSCDVTERLQKIKGAKHIITSAKYNMNVTEAFEYGLNDIIRTLHTLSMSLQPRFNEEHENEGKENRNSLVPCFAFRL